MFDLFLHTQGELPPSLRTLLEVHNVSAYEYQRTQFPTQPSLERYRNLRAVTMHVRRGLEPCLPALPLSVRTLTLDAGFGCAGCECDTSWLCPCSVQSPSDCLLNGCAAATNALDVVARYCRP